MVVLDTNVLSELLRPAPDGRVLAWLDRFPVERLFTTSVTEAEMRFGAKRLPPSRRRSALQQGVDRLFERLLAGRVLPFDSRAAHAYAEIASARRAAGRIVPALDMQIAAIARARNAALASRNARHFDFGELEVIDPWSAGAQA